MPQDVHKFFSVREDEPERAALPRRPDIVAAMRAGGKPGDVPKFEPSPPKVRFIHNDPNDYAEDVAFYKAAYLAMIPTGMASSSRDLDTIALLAVDALRKFRKENKS